MNPQQEEKSLSDPSYNLSDFKVQVCGGGLRWLATMLFGASIALLAYFAATADTPEIDFPIHLQGRAVFRAVGSVAAVWFLVALVNWKSWLRRRTLPR
jgi:hypothetical protein